MRYLKYYIFFVSVIYFGANSLTASLTQTLEEVSENTPTLQILLVPEVKACRPLGYHKEYDCEKFVDSSKVTFDKEIIDLRQYSYGIMTSPAKPPESICLPLEFKKKLREYESSDNPYHRKAIVLLFEWDAQQIALPVKLVRNAQPAPGVIAPGIINVFSKKPYLNGYATLTHERAEQFKESLPISWTLHTGEGDQARQYTWNISSIYC